MAGLAGGAKDPALERIRPGSFVRKMFHALACRIILPDNHKHLVDQNAFYIAISVIAA